MAAPVFQFVEFSTSAVEPTGMHLNNDTAFVKVLGTAANQHLDFGNNDISASGINSSTKVVIARLVSSGDMTTEAFNLKFWLSNTSSFSAGTLRYNFFPSLDVWRQNFVLQNNSSHTVPTTLPTSGNILRIDGSGVINSSGASGVSEFLYVSVFTGTDVPVGVYGGPGAGSFRFRLTADYY